MAGMEVLQRTSDVDFKAATLDGAGTDWPFEYADLVPYYDRVKDLVGVYGDDDTSVAPAREQVRRPRAPQ